MLTKCLITILLDKKKTLTVAKAYIYIEKKDIKIVFRNKTNVKS